MSDQPIFDHLARLYGQPHKTLYDSVAERMAAAYLTDDLLEAVMTKWAEESC